MSVRSAGAEASIAITAPGVLGAKSRSVIASSVAGEHVAGQSTSSYTAEHQRVVYG